MLMATALDFTLSDAPASTCLPLLPTQRQRMPGLVHEIACPEPVGVRQGYALDGLQTKSPEVLQEAVPRQLLADPTQWWDSRWSKPSPLLPDVTDKEALNKRVALWLTNWHKLCSVDSLLSKLDAGIKLTSSQWRGGFALHEDHLGTFSTAESLCRCPTFSSREGGSCSDFWRKPDKFLQAGLINMYAKCGSPEDTRNLFDQLLDRDVVTWTATISGYAQQGMGPEALGLYRSMQQEGLTRPNSVTFLCLLKACASVGVEALDEGNQLHAQIRERGLQDDVLLGGSLVNMYAKCGSLGDARSVFDKLPNKNIVACNAMIAGYTEQGLGQDALNLFRTVRKEGIPSPDNVTYLCLLQACASVGVAALDEAKQLHALITERSLQVDNVLGGSLVNTYAKCGSLEDARRVFDKLPERDVVTWTAMIAGYAQQGKGVEALNL